MITFPMMPGIEINLFLLIFLGLAIGIMSGFVGVGGGFLMTPALIILGFPAHFAVGTSLAWIIGSSIVGTLRHRQLDNVDIKLGMVMIAGTLGGVEVGVGILNRARYVSWADEAVLSTSIGMLLIIGVYTFYEVRQKKAQLDTLLRGKEKLPPSMKLVSVSSKLPWMKIPPVIHFAKSGTAMSLWLILVAGFVTGVLAGFIGVGGGFILMPLLIYIIGVPPFMAVGTSMFQIIFPAAWGGIRHTLNGNVIIFAAVIMLLGSSIGVQFGVLATRYVRGIAMRYVFALSIPVAILGSILKLIDVLSESSITWLQTAVVAVTFGGLGLIVALILGLLVMAKRYGKGQHIPIWIKSLVAKDG